MTIDRDSSIVAQVAAKAAVEVSIAKSETLEETLTNFSVAFNYIRNEMFEVIGCQPLAGMTVALEQAFPNSHTLTVAQAAAPQRDLAPVAAPQGTVRVVGTQHGELPSWLFTAAAQSGTTKVYDNRDGLAQNAKRPWFKDADNKEVAFWPPRGR
jgi:hypothetical protein